MPKLRPKSERKIKHINRKHENRHARTNTPTLQCSNAPPNSNDPMLHQHANAPPMLLPINVLPTLQCSYAPPTLQRPNWYYDPTLHQTPQRFSTAPTPNAPKPHQCPYAPPMFQRPNVSDIILCAMSN